MTGACAAVKRKEILIPLPTRGSDSIPMKELDKLSRETNDSVFCLLELAANNDVEGFKRSLGTDMSAVNCAGLWYLRNIDSMKITEEERTPLMVAASYGSIDVVKLLVALPEVDVSNSCGRDKWTALHCAASGGSVHAYDVVKLLLSAGSNPCIRDANGRMPVDVIVVPPKLPGARAALEDLLLNNFSDGSVDVSKDLCVSGASLSPETRSPCSLSDFIVPKAGGASVNSVSEKKQYPVDPSFPDIRDSVYSGDEFRMYLFKVKPCSRAYSHDWTECPFAHPGENARRRDPRKYHYTCVPCPDFRKRACKNGDMCEYAHGVFESWLHPAQYRTRLCKDGTSCARQVCFFAHTRDELRPLYVSSGSGVSSPRSPGYMDMAAALNFLPGSPTSQSVMSPVFNHGMSPTAIGMSQAAGAWPQANAPTVYLPGSNASRLRSSINARDIPEFSQTHPYSPLSFVRSKTTLTPSNIEELFSNDISSSPRYGDQTAALNQFHPQQRILSPIKTSKVFAPRNVERSLLQASFGVSSPLMSPRSTEPSSPVSARLAAFAQQQRSLSSRDLGANRGSLVGSPTTVWSSFGSPNRKLDWGEDQRFELKTYGEEPDLSWVQSLVKESPLEMMEKTTAQISSAAPSGECPVPTSRLDSVDPSVLGAWLEQMHLDQLAA